MENKTTTALPEELVSRHLEKIIFHDVIQSVASERCASITIEYMGRFAEWASNSGWKCMTNNNWYHYNNHRILNTSQLIDLFFEQNKK